MSILDIFDTPSPIPRGISTTPINHLFIPEERLTFPELVHCYRIRSFVDDLQWANYDVPISREECQAAWFAYLEREWDKYQDADYEPPVDGVEVPSEEDLLERLGVMISDAYKNNWRTDAERKASEAKGETRRARVKQEVGTYKPKVVINKCKDEWKKRQQEAIMVHQLEIAMSQIDFEPDSSASKTVAKPTDQQMENDHKNLNFEWSGDKVAAKKSVRPAKIVKQSVTPKLLSARRSCSLLASFTFDACEIGEKSEAEALVQTVMADTEMDVDNIM